MTAALAHVGRRIMAVNGGAETWASAGRGQGRGPAGALARMLQRQPQTRAARRAHDFEIDRIVAEWQAVRAHAGPAGGQMGLNAQRAGCRIRVIAEEAPYGGDE